MGLREAIIIVSFFIIQKDDIMGKKLTTTKEIIEQFKKVHGNKYNYSETEYVNCTTKLKIICPKHGIFYQRLYHHRNGVGCPKCATDNNIVSHEKTIEDFKNIHGNIYDYSRVKYINNSTKVEIICKDHGGFWQVPSMHKRGVGCPRCGGTGILTQEKIIEQFKEAHGDKYDYSEVQYVNGRTKVEIICEKHGVFLQTPRNHKKGIGCKKCGDEISGWTRTNWIKSGDKSKYFDGFKLYIIKCWNDNKKFYKIGITYKKIHRRFCAKSSMPYQWKLINSIEGSGEYIYDLENELHRKFKQYKYIPDIEFKGCQECFNTDLNIQEVLSYIESI